MSRIGLCDTPLERSADDCLGLDRYARALACFAEKCETPMTIALQGDWGSGKTSLMNLIREQLSERKEHYVFVWFNTWQYSQFGCENLLATSLISFFINALPDNNNADKASLKKITAHLGRVVSAVGSEVGGLSGAAIKAASSLMAADENTATDPSEHIADLKKKLSELVEKITGRNDERRIVVFIDDLDRLAPVKAVELLEAFKLFLDIRGCVFFLACDYKVVNQGLAAKFGAEIASNNEKNFFDKIIQLPFKMPVLQYEVRHYIGTLLGNIGISYDESDIEKYLQLIVTSIGFNPRGLKRVFNTLLLLKQVASVTETSGADNDSVTSVDQSEKDRLLFAIICIQSSYEAFYNYIYQFDAKGIVTLFDKLRSIDDPTEDETICKLYKDLGTEYKQERFQEFIDALYRSMQLNFNGKEDVLSQEEAQIFLKMLQLSQVTSTSQNTDNLWQQEQNYDVRYINKVVCGRLKAFLDQKCRPLIEKKGENVQFAIHWHRGRSDMEVVFWQPNEKFNWIGVSLGRTVNIRTPYCFSIDVGLYNHNEIEIIEDLQNLIKDIAPADMEIVKLQVVNEGTPWFSYVTCYREEHNLLDPENLYQKILSAANMYFEIFLRV